jgi:hypothetical protein
MECSRLIAVSMLIGCRGCGPDVPTAPPRGTVVVAPAALSPSSVQVPLSIDIAEMESTIQEQLPSPLVKEEAVPVKSGVLADIEIRRDGQLQLQGRESGQLRIIVPLSIQASAYHQLQVRNRRRSSEPRKASVEARLQLFIDLDFDISADWHLKTAANVHYR